MVSGTHCDSPHKPATTTLPQASAEESSEESSNEAAEEESSEVSSAVVWMHKRHAAVSAW